MKILQVIPYLTPKRGGDVNVCYNISKQLAKRRHDVTIITTNFELDKEYVKSIESENVKVVAFPCVFNLSLFLYSPLMKKWLKNNLHEFDVIHFHTFRAYQNSIIQRYAKKYGVPYILQAHGSLPTTGKRTLKKMYDVMWGNRILENASKVIALTQTEKEQYKKMGVNKSKIEIVPNGIDMSEFENLPKRGEFRKKYRIKNNEKLILYVGRIHWTKGLDLLVDAFKEVQKALPNTKLALVGPDAGYEAIIKEKIEGLNLKEDIIFTGFVPKDEKISAFVDADIFITPSFYGFPITFLEACVCGTPIITTNRGDELDWIQDKVGYIVDYNKDQLCDAMIKILNDEELRRGFGEEGKRLIFQEFNWDHIVQVLEKIYS